MWTNGWARAGAAGVAAILLVAGVGLARAQGAERMGRASANQIAERAIETASALADMLDVGRGGVGAELTIEAALALARETAPKPLDGMGAWMAGPLSSVRARVSDPMLCRALMDQCQERTRPGMTVCGCQPDGGGDFVFALRIDAPESGASTGNNE